MVDKQIGSRIRKQRELMGYTREVLAEKIDVTPKFCSDIELGNKGMSVETLCKLSKELLVPTDYILFGTSNENIDEEINNLIKLCPENKFVYLKNIIKNFIKSC